MHTDFENETYESANEAVLFCASYLAERRERNAALYLEGLDTICDQSTGRLARSCLNAALQHTSDECAQHMIRSALNAVDRAMRTPLLLAAS